MRSKVRFGVLCAVLCSLLFGCDWIASLFWPSVTLADANEAVAAVMKANEECIHTCSVDTGSTSTLGKAANAAGTLGIEFSIPLSSYPRSRKYIYNGYTESSTGYTLTGTVAVIWTNSGVDGTCTVDVSLTHDAKPVRKIKGDLTNSGSTAAGELSFNNDSYGIDELTTDYFFSS